MKFRVFHKELNKYLNVGDYYRNARCMIIDIAISEHNCYIYLHFDGWLKAYPIEYIIGKDVEIDWGFEYEGKEYFENDIIAVHDTYVKVEFYENRFIGYEIGNDYIFDITLFSKQKIIGNLRENPELLEKL